MFIHTSVQQSYRGAVSVDSCPQFYSRAAEPCHLADMSKYMPKYTHNMPEKKIQQHSGQG